MSAEQGQAPEEVHAPTHEKERAEMTQEERKATRNAQKERRHKGIKGKLVRFCLVGDARTFVAVCRVTGA